MNCLSWNVGHLAWQEQRYFVTRAQGRTPFPEIAERFAVGAPGTTPALAEVLAAWRAITAEADPWLDAVTSDGLLEHPVGRGGPLSVTFGNMLQRTIYHYWYHTGENQAIRQQLGHARLPQFVGNIDGEAPYRPRAARLTGRAPGSAPGDRRDDVDVGAGRDRRLRARPARRRRTR